MAGGRGRSGEGNGDKGVAGQVEAEDTPRVLPVLTREVHVGKSCRDGKGLHVTVGLEALVTMTLTHDNH